MELHECLNPDLTTIRDYVKGYRLFTTTTNEKRYNKHLILIKLYKSKTQQKKYKQ
jgi:hypothetical protein